MVIHDFDGMDAVRLPDKANTPLVIDANAVLAFSIARKGFKAVPWRYPQILKTWRCVELQKLAPRRGFKVPETSNINAQEQLFGIEAFE